MNTTYLTYRRTAAEGASGFGILIALYDTLAGDLRRAASAQRDGNLTKRAREVNHALVVLGLLENWIEPDGGELAKKLIALYAALRRRMIEAQARQSAPMLEEIMAEVLAIRAIWQKLDSGDGIARPDVFPPVVTQRSENSFAAPQERTRSDWTA